MKKSKTEGLNNSTPSSPGLRRPNEQPPQQEPPSAARRTSSQLEGNDYKSKRAGEFMPSMVIPGVKYPGAPPPTSQANLNRQRSKSADSSRKELARRKTIPNTDVPKVVEQQKSDTLRAVTFGPTDINKDDNIKANITLFAKPKPGQGQSRPDQNARRNSAEKEKRASSKGHGGFNLTPAPDHQRQRHSLNASHTHHRPNEHQGRRSSIGADDKMKGHGEPQGAAKPAKGGGWGWSAAGRKTPEKHNIPTEVTISTKHQYIGPQVVIKPEPQVKSPDGRAAEQAAQAEQRKQIREIGIKPSGDQKLKSQDSQNDRGKIVVTAPAKETNGGGSGAPNPGPASKPKEKISEKLAIPGTGNSYESVDLWWWPSEGDEPKNEKVQPPAAGGTAAPTQIQAPPSQKPPPPSENARAQEQQQPRPVSPKTETLFKTQPSGSRRVIQNTSHHRAPVQQTSGRRILTETYQPEDTSIDNIKIQISVAKVLPKPAQQQPPPPPPEEPKPPPPPRPKSAEPLAPPVPPKPIAPPPPEQKAPPRVKSEPIIVLPPPPPPKPVKTKISLVLPPSNAPPRKQTLEEPASDKERTNSKALLEYINTIAKLSNEELEHDAIPSPEFADDNIQLIEILKKFEIPDQQRALDSLLDTDSVHFNFGGLMREYYSYMLRSYAPINMQDRYRSVSSPAHCFTSVDLSKIGTREQEMEKVTRAKLRKLDEKRENLRHVATDEDHFKFLKNLANDQSTLLPLTLVHMLNEQMAPIMEDVFRFYGKNLGTEHKSTKEAGFHYMKIRKRCEMYTHICGGSTINEDLSPFYK